MAKSVMKPRRTARLPQAPDTDRRHLETLIDVADSSRARFLRPSQDRRRLVSAGRGEMTAAEARRPVRDLITERPGRGFGAAGSAARHAFESAHDPRKMAKHKFVERLARVLKEDCADGEFDRLVLVAPPRTLGELRGLLPDRVKRTLTHEVAKDLTAASPVSLRKLLSAALMPATAP